MRFVSHHVWRNLLAYISMRPICLLRSLLAYLLLDKFCKRFVFTFVYGDATVYKKQ